MGKTWGQQAGEIGQTATTVLAPKPDDSSSVPSTSEAERTDSTSWPLTTTYAVTCVPTHINKIHLFKKWGSTTAHFYQSLVVDSL